MDTQPSLPKIPGFKITGEIAQGGMATVYAGASDATGEAVAIKVMAAALGLDPSFRRRFMEECQITKDLAHRHIIRIPAFGCVDSLYYMVMVRLPGGTLAERMAAGMSEHEAIAVVRQLAEALGYAHRRGIVHRDIKPSNVLFDADGAAVLTDFGIAKAVQAATRMTRTGMVVGTPEYMSPEQSAGRPLDGRSDLYSLGVLFYEMLTGELPYQAEDAFAIALKHRDDPIPRLPARLADRQPVIDRLLAKRPEERFNDAAELLDALTDRPTSSTGDTVIWQTAATVPSRRVTPAFGTTVLHAPTGRPARATPALGATALTPPTAATERRTPALGTIVADSRTEARAPRITPAFGATQFAPAPPIAPTRSEPSSIDGAPFQAMQAAPSEETAATPTEPARTIPSEKKMPRTARHRWVLGGATTVLPVAAVGIGWLIIGPREAPREEVPVVVARSVQIGSTPDEIEAALQVCAQYRQDFQRAWYEDETLRTVTLTPFALDRTEVTNAEFARFVEATGYVTAAEKLGYSTRYDPQLLFAKQVRGYTWKAPDGPGSTYEDRLDHPVTHMSYYDADAFCHWRGMRLPTAAEWEYAARGEARRTFPWGAEWNPTLAHWENGNAQKTLPVGSFAAGNTPDGTADLAGSVWEWTSTLENGLAVLKGGSWTETNPANLRAAARRLEDPNVPALDNGFRCAIDLDQWPRRDQR